jgi:hypothetical protein
MSVGAHETCIAREHIHEEMAGIADIRYRHRVGRPAFIGGVGVNVQLHDHFEGVADRCGGVYKNVSHRVVFVYLRIGVDEREPAGPIGHQIDRAFAQGGEYAAAGKAASDVDQASELAIA